MANPIESPQPFTLDKGYGDKVALGLIVLATDETLEPEIAPVIHRAGIPLYQSRISSHPDVTRETLLQMESDLPTAAGLLPTGVNFAAIGYGCTSASTIIGPQRVAVAIQTAHPDVPVTDPITAVIAALAKLRVKRLGFVTPYIADVSAAMRQMLEHHGIEISAFASFSQVEERVVARISEESVLQAVQNVGQNCDAVFTSCTNLRSFNIIAQAETRIGKPVISSNSALAWHMMRLAGMQGQIAGPGHLFTV